MNNSIIIFEGLDRIGKSSHIDSLINIWEDINIPYITFHCEGPDNKIAQSTSEKVYYQLFTFYNQLKRINNHINKTNIIFDRSFFGEAIWSKYYNRQLSEELDLYDNNKNYLGYVVETIMNTDVYKSIQDRLFIITLTADINNVIKRIKYSDEDSRIYTQFCCCDIQKNVEFINNEFLRLHNILTQKGVKTLKLQSNNSIDINKNIQTILSNIL